MRFINHIFTISFFSHAILELTNDSTYLYCIFKDEKKKKKIHKELKEMKKNSHFAIAWNNISIKRILTGKQP